MLPRLDSPSALPSSGTMSGESADVSYLVQLLRAANPAITWRTHAKMNENVIGKEAADGLRPINGRTKLLL
jgi:hypothetical protein